MSVSAQPQRASPKVLLTPGEARVLPLLATHLTLCGVGERLGVSRSTVKTHVANIYRKLGASTRAEAVELAEASGCLQTERAAHAVLR